MDKVLTWYHMEREFMLEPEMLSIRLEFSGDSRAGE
jgi:hypothetical protein